MTEEKFNEFVEKLTLLSQEYGIAIVGGWAGETELVLSTKPGKYEARYRPYPEGIYLSHLDWRHDKEEKKDEV